MILRKIDRILSEGNGRQLIWLLSLTVLCIGGAIAIDTLIFDDNILSWQDIVGLFLDPGVFGSFAHKGHDFFRLTIALLSVFLFSALLVSVFTNVFENIASSVREGNRRYSLKKHILILGSGNHLEGLLKQYGETNQTIVVMSSSKPQMDSNVIYYHGRIDDEEQLKSACVASADTIYIIGEDNESAHDAMNLHCLDLVKKLCEASSKDIHCYITLKEHVSSEVFQYMEKKEHKETDHLLLVDVINDYEYAAEQLLVNTDFLPVIKQGDNKSSHIIILGIGSVAQAVAYTSAHISHYPTEKKTKITFVAEGMRKWMDDMVIARPGLFELSVYTYISKEGKVERHTPDKSKGDYLDIEWEFVDSYESSFLAQTILQTAVTNDTEIVTIYVCHEDTNTATSSVLHLPRIVYDNAYNIAVYLTSSTEIIYRANQSGMYGSITIFGRESDNRNTSLIKRSNHGKRVNYIYDKAYGNPPSKDEEEAWYKIPEAHKYSSICSANAMFMFRKCFDMNGDRHPVYEAEHRRWMMSVLIMGYTVGEVTDKERFIHENIVPYDMLTKEVQDKDKDIIDAMDFILS